ncbi:MAG: Rieske (2Fe-2S) protein [Alicyclobacillus sp.]|nr:Rieske (2Fe-2S) protein [Alicyclobacillus sp.]
MKAWVCHLSDLREREPLTVSLGNIEVGVIRNNGQLFAYENRCPHQGGPVCLGDVFHKVLLQLREDGSVIRETVSDTEFRLVCPWHGIEYDLATGVCPFDAQFRLRRFEVWSEGDDVFVEC